MNLSFRRAICLVLLCSAWEGLGWKLEAQAVAPVAATTVGPTNVPPLPVFRPPTEIFRGLLKMNPEQLGRILTNQRPELRQQLEGKIREYQALAPETREARLHATELHDYLLYFIKSAATDRSNQLTTVPVEYREDVRIRLAQFDRLPPDLRNEAMTHAATAGYFVGPPTPPMPPPVFPVPPRPTPPPPMPPDPMTSLKTLSVEERAEVFASFDHFFDLDQNERQKVVAAIPANERAQVARTLAQIGRQPREQREQSLQALSTLAAMTDQQRQLFFNSAERWKAMTPAEQATWLKVVSHLPPAPPMPPPPSSLPRRGPLSVATNPGN